MKHKSKKIKSINKLTKTSKSNKSIPQKSIPHSIFRQEKDTVETQCTNLKKKYSSLLLGSHVLECLPKNLENDKEVAMKAIEANQYYFEGLPLELRDDKDVAVKVLNHDQLQFAYVSDRLKDDKQLAMETLRKSISKGIWVHLSDRLKLDKDIIKQFDFKKIEGNEITFKNKLNKENLLQLCNELKKKYTQFTISLMKFAEDDLKNDKKIALKLVEFSKLSYQDISNKLKKDHDVIKALIRNQGFSEEDIKYVPNNKDFALFIMEHHPELYPKMDKLSCGYYKDKDILLKALQTPTYMNSLIEFIPDELKNDIDVKKRLELTHLAYISKKNSENKAFVIKSLKKYNTLPYVSPRLLNDKDIMLTALKYGRYNTYSKDKLKNIPLKIKNDKDIYLGFLENQINYRKKELIGFAKENKIRGPPIKIKKD
jgi:hypothetical protein